MLYKVAIVDDEPEVIKILTDLLDCYRAEKQRGGGHSCVLFQYGRRIVKG